MVAVLALDQFPSTRFFSLLPVSCTLTSVRVKGLPVWHYSAGKNLLFLCRPGLLSQENKLTVNIVKRDKKTKKA